MPDHNAVNDNDDSSLPGSPEVTRTSRRGFLTLGAITCGAALAAGALPAHALEYGDSRLLSFLQEVERVELTFFNRVALSATAAGLRVAEMSAFNKIAYQDGEHHSWLHLGRRQVGVGQFDTVPGQGGNGSDESFNGFTKRAPSNRTETFMSALFLKETSVRAYQGALQRTQSDKIAQAIASLAGVESRHLAILLQLDGKDPLVTTEDALSSLQVANRLEKYGFRREVL